MKPPIPPYTVVNLCAGIGDVMRAAGACGMADASGSSSDAHLQLLAQAVAQLLTLCLQREPTDQEMSAVVGG